VPKKQQVFGGLCDIISVDGVHDMTALEDFRNFKPLANPHRHLVLADDCTAEDVFNKLHAENANIRNLPDVWTSWQTMIKEGHVVHNQDFVHGGKTTPQLENGNFLKGWCEGTYIF